ncbi:MAG TPA: hypothetical protein VHC72_01275, partial [Bryobacteraceae bacterium]|nr:hypothetical protein [Bryobacteraceae bacterium]
MQRFNRLVLSGFVACSMATIASADNLYLRDGQTVTGTFLGGTARQVRIEVSGQVRTYDVGLVQSITFDAPPAEPQADRFSSAPPPPPAPSEPPAPVASAEPPSTPPPSTPPAPGLAQRSASASVSAPHGATIPAETTVTIRMVDSVNSETSRLGQTFMASLDEPIVVRDRVIVPRGADVMTKLVDDEEAGKLQGRTVQTLALVSMNVNGQWLSLTSNDVRTESGSQGSKTAKLAG